MRYGWVARILGFGFLGLAAAPWPASADEDVFPSVAAFFSFPPSSDKPAPRVAEEVPVAFEVPAVTPLFLENQLAHKLVHARNIDAEVHRPPMLRVMTADRTSGQALEEQLDHDCALDSG